MNNSNFISPFTLSPKFNKRHKKCSSDINENYSNKIDLLENVHKKYALKEEEIISLKNEFNKYSHDYGLLISELNFWKKILDKKICEFLKNIQDFMNNELFKFVQNFNHEKADFNDCIKFKKIFNETFRTIYKPFMNSNDFSLSKSLLNELITFNNVPNDINKFIICSSKVLSYIVELNKKCQNSFGLNEQQNKISNIDLSSVNVLDNDNKPAYTEKKIIEKYIDFKDSYSLNRNKKILPLQLYSQSSITPRNFNNIKNINKNGDTNIESLKTSQTSYNLLKTPKSRFKKNIYLRKSTTPIVNKNFYQNFQIENLKSNNDSVNLILNNSQTIEGNKYLNNNFSMKNCIQLNKNSSKFLEFSSLRKTNNLNNKNKFNSSEKINNNLDFQKNSQKNCVEKEQKIYIHRKMINSNLMSNNFKKNIEKINGKNHLRSNSNLITSSSNKMLNLENINLKNSSLINKGKNFINSISRNDKIKSSIFKLFNTTQYGNFQNGMEKENKKTNDSIKYEPFVTKTKYDDKILIDSDFPLYLGLDLGDNNCKISLMNGKSNEIKLISFKQDIYNIPTIIYFDKIKEEIKIGFDAENQGIKDSNQMIYNLLKYIGICFEDIIGKKELLPFRIYKSDINKRPYIKVDFNGQKDKIFYFEDILSLFIYKLFEKLFNKINLQNPNNTSINLFVVLSLPNYLTYLQKKIIEKIFYNQIFPQNIVYNGYKINLKKINLVSSTNISYLYEIISKDANNIKNSDEKNVLIINSDKCSINISVVHINKQIYEVKAIESASFGEEDLNDNYLCYCIRNLENKENINLIKFPSLLYQIKRNISLFKKNLDVISQMQLMLDVNNCFNGNGKNNIEIILKKDDYEIACEDFFKKIFFLIKEVIFKSKVLNSDFNELILIGQTAKSKKMKKILSEIFEKNKNINEILSSKSYNKEIESEQYTVIGGVIQSLNNNNLLKQKYSFIDICPCSFGVESIDGMMEIILEKGNILPSKNKKLVKINNTGDNICINIFEGEDRYVKNNKFIVTATITKKNLGYNNNKNYADLYIQLELDNDNNLKCFIDEPFFKNRYECLININVVKN